MKKLLYCLFIFATCAMTAQESYWTQYYVVVEPQEVGTIYKLMDDYFTANPPEGVTVSLWENHFNDPGNNFTHSIGFSGSLDAMGNMYAADGGAAWSLFLTRLNQHIKDGYGARMGTMIAHEGDLEQDYPVQKYFIVHAEDGQKWNAAYMKVLKANTPAGMLAMMGNFTSGVSSDGENRWVLQGFKDFKGALGGPGAMRTDAENAAADKVWDTFLDSNGESHLVRSGMRVRMGQWK